MKLVRMAELCSRLGIPRRTFNLWVQKDPDLAVFIANNTKVGGGGAWWIKIETLAERSGLSLVQAYRLATSRWVKAVDLAKFSKISRRTVASWCRNRPGFACRLGRVWYVDLEQLGANEEQIQELQLRISGKVSPEEE